MQAVRFVAVCSFDDLQVFGGAAADRDDADYGGDDDERGWPSLYSGQWAGAMQAQPTPRGLNADCAEAGLSYPRFDNPWFTKRPFLNRPSRQRGCEGRHTEAESTVRE
jgi:hypothetical protein